MKAKDVMTRHIITVGPGASVKHVGQLMLDHKISGVPVIDDDGKLTGMITEGDLMGRFELGLERLDQANGEESARAYVKSHSWCASDVMTRDVVTVDERAPVSEVARRLEECGIKRMPVVREGKLVGIVSRADLLRALAMARVEETAPGDEAIRCSIIAKLHEDSGVRDELMSVTVLDGAVHLWGEALSEAERDAARVVAENTRAAKSVENHLRVVPE